MFEILLKYSLILSLMLNFVTELITGSESVVCSSERMNLEKSLT